MGCGAAGMTHAIASRTESCADTKDGNWKIEKWVIGMPLVT